jgi:hypothetical protein
MKLLKCLSYKIGCWKGATSISTKPSWSVDRHAVNKFLTSYFKWIMYWQFLARTSLYASPPTTGMHYLRCVITKSLNMPWAVTPTQYRLLVYKTAANLRLSFTQTQDSITIPDHLQNIRFEDCALVLKRILVGVFSQATTCILCYTRLHPLPNNESLKTYDAEYRTNSQCSSQVWQSFISQLTEKLIVKDLPSFHGSQSFYCRVSKDPPPCFRYISRVFNKTGRQFTYNIPARSRYVRTSSAILTFYSHTALLWRFNPYPANVEKMMSS